MGSDSLRTHLSFSFANLAMLQSCWDDPHGGQERGLVPRAGSAWGGQPPAASLQAPQRLSWGQLSDTAVPAVGWGEQGGN